MAERIRKYNFENPECLRQPYNKRDKNSPRVVDLYVISLINSFESTIPDCVTDTLLEGLNDRQSPMMLNIILGWNNLTEAERDEKRQEVSIGSILLLGSLKAKPCEVVWPYVRKFMDYYDHAIFPFVMSESK